MPDDPAFVEKQTTAKHETDHPGDDPATEEAQRTTAVTKVETPPPTRSWETQNWIAYLIVGLIFGFLYLMLWWQIWNPELAVVTGALLAVLKDISGYFYGSSIGSSRKSEQIAKMTNGAH